MPRFKNRTNDRYGRLLVVCHAGKDGRNKHLWDCLCDCGNKKIVVSDNLSSGKSKSCGCLRVEFLKRSGNQFGAFLNREDAILKVQYSHLKRRNRKYREDIISFEVFKQIVKKNCSYCGSPPHKMLPDRSCETISKKLISETIVMCSGIDRVKNKNGYTLENSVPCCKTCNSAKGELSLEEFKKWANNLFRNINESNISA